MNATIRQIASREELQSLVERAIDDRTPLVDYGVAHAGLGHAPPAVHTAYTQRATHDGVIEHYARDLTVRAAAGATFRELNETLEDTGQFLPLDADDDMTLGEIIAHDVYGPLRAGFGSVRDLLLGLRYIDGLGRDIHVGGRTVKNVAGYDVTRMLVGGLGELGIVYEATLRTYAMPEEVRAIALTINDPGPFCAAITDMMLTDASPTALSVHSDAPGEPWIVRIGYFNSALGCDAQYEALRNFLPTVPDTHGKVETMESRSVGDDHKRRRASRAWRRSAAALVKIVVPPATTGDVVRTLRDAMPRTAMRIDAMPVHGCIFAGGDLSADDAAALDRTTNAIIGKHRGFRVWYRRPTEAIEPFAPRQGDATLLCRIKRTMDPYNLFNPGRYLQLEA